MAPKPLSATARAKRSRQATKRVVSRELELVAIIGRLGWQSYITEPRTKQANFPAVLMLKTPAGWLAWRLSDEELPLFDHLEKRPNDGTQQEDKEAVLLHLASEGW